MKIGDTITESQRPCAEALPGFKEIQPMVFSGIYPVSTDDFEQLKLAMGKLQINDAAFNYLAESSVALVFGFGQMIESMVLTPVLVGDRIGLHPVAVIFALMVGGQLAGFVGVLVALPVAAVVTVFARHAIDHYRSTELYGGGAE